MVILFQRHVCFISKNKENKLKCLQEALVCKPVPMKNTKMLISFFKRARLASEKIFIFCLNINLSPHVSCAKDL